MAGSGGCGETLKGGAGGGRRRGEGGLAAEFGGDVALDVDTIRGAGGGGPAELDLIADALGGEVGDDLGKVE